MNHRLKITSLCVLLFAAALTVNARDWRGLTPLISTREDVIRLLWEPEPQTIGERDGPTDEDLYHLPEGYLDFNYAKRLGERREAFSVSIRPGVLLFIRFTPNEPLTWNEAQLNQRDFRRYGAEPKNENWNEGYFDDANGTVVSVFKGKIEKIAYLPRREDIGKTTEYFRWPESFLPVYDRNLEADSGRFEFCHEEIDSDNCEKARLDNLAIQMQIAPGAQGYIVTYVARSDGNYKEVTDRLLDYLVNYRRIDRGRLIVIDGGYSDEFYYDLVCVPVGGEPPTATPNNNLPRTESPEKERRR